MALAGAGSFAQERVLNLYSARHYQTDEALYSNFTKTTGIRINRVDTDDSALLARLRAEGSASPADVVLLVDAARFQIAEAEGLFQPLKSKLLEERIPAGLRGRDAGTGSQWFGFSTRARVLVIDKNKLKKADVDTYEELAAPALKGQICIRSGSHPYNLSLFGALLEHWGPQRTETWLKAVVDNLARPPRGGDTDQIRAVAAGECSVAVTNTYYLARLMRSDKPEDKAVVDKIEVVFPNQASFGTHMNISGGAIARHAKNREAAQLFLEYLASAEAQAYFANGNNEWPTAVGVKIDNPALTRMGSFRAETIAVAQVAANTTRVQQMLDRVGFK
jgi:iron(III) transport system substrate-binding protein